jgi:hypothetical protein
MPIISKAVASAKADIDRLGPEIEKWTDEFIELLGNVTHLDLVFQETAAINPNYLALCDWGDSSRLEVIHTIAAKQTAEQRKKTLAMTSVITAMLHTFGHFEVAVVLLGDEVGKTFRHEGLTGHCRTIRGCSHTPLLKPNLNFASSTRRGGHRTSLQFSN